MQFRPARGRVRPIAGLGIVAAVAVLSSPSGLAEQRPLSNAAGGAGDAAIEYGALLDRYCVTCHTTRQFERGAVPIALDSLDLGAVPDQAESWERVVRKMRAGLMPPRGLPRPEPEAHEAFLGWLEGTLDRAAEVAPDPGRTETFHRLNRAEYRNAVRDLLGLEVDVATLLPSDDSSYGFDNIAGVLRISPTLLERYLSAARNVSRLAVGTPPLFPSIDYFRVPDDRAQESRLPGMPFGSRGGVRIPYNFPLDADYEISVELARDLNESMPLYAEPQDLEISVDGARVELFTLEGVPYAPPPEPRPDAAGTGQNPPISQIVQRFQLNREGRARRNRADEDWRIRIPVTSGPHEVTVTFLGKTAALDETPRLPFLRPYPAGVNIPETRTGSYLLGVEISGPYGATGPGESPSRTRIFMCHPNAGESAAAQPGSADAETPCATRILRALARRAFRRPVTEADLEPLLEFYRTGRERGTFDDGIELALRRLLVSPEFLFRIEHDPDGVAPGAPYRIDDLTLASRLSFFLWSSIPDDELLELAEHGTLSSPGTLERQVRRMVADPRADAFIESFAGQWLFLRNLQATVPVQSVFPDFDDTLRQGFRRETELFFGSIVREDRSALDLLRADYTFLNERVARHYGIPHVKGSHFRRVVLPESSHRRGLLGQGSILTVTSYPDRTSPVVRGKWVLENLLGTPPPPPLPNVPALTATDGEGSVISMRERLAAHRANPVCASCHAMMDPLGFSLENFDAVGKWRTLEESGTRIDAHGSMPDGHEFEGAAGLREALLASDRFLATMTERMLTYALGRGVQYYDQPTVRAIVRRAAEHDYRFSDFILGIVESPAFRMRRAQS